MSLRGLLPLAALALVSSAACAAVTPAAALVNGARISEGEVQQELDRVSADPSYQQALQSEGQGVRGAVRRTILRNLIVAVVEQQEARRLGIRVRPSDVSHYLDQLRAQLGGTVAFSQALAQNGLSLARARVLAQRQLYQQDLQAAVTKGLQADPAQVQAYYQANAARFTQLHLLRATLPTRDAAMAFAAQVAAGSDFGALARAQSRDEAAGRGGDLGYVDQTQLPAAALGQLTTLAVGAVSQPVASESGGYEVYKLLDRRLRPLQEVYQQIADGLLAQRRQQAFASWLQSRLRAARVVVNPKYGRFDPATGQVVQASAALPG